MTQYFLYLLESSICLSLFYMTYWFLLKNDTFHRLKRIYLISSIIVSIIIPVLPSTSITKRIEKKIFPAQIENIQNSYSHNTFEKLIFSEVPIDRYTAITEKESINFFTTLFLVYIIGSLFMFMKLVINLRQLILLMKGNIHKRNEKYTIISLPNDYPTFSFFSFIFLNENNLNTSEKDYVLLHEATHIRQGHSFDILFIEACKILFWFIPVIWQFKQSIVKVHECLADEGFLKLKTGKIQEYQSLLLKQYLSNFKIELAHPFNFSLIKFRIKMMTKTKSKWWAKYKLIFAIPIIVLSLVAFTNDKLNSGKTDLMQAKLNQHELFKKFIGTWRYELNKDTAFTLVCKPYNNDGLDVYLKEEAGGKILIEQKGLLKYDPKGDRLIQQNPEINNLSYPIAMWFTSDVLCEAGEVHDISSSDRVPTERKWEFRSDDLLILSVLVNGKFLDALALKRKNI